MPARRKSPKQHIEDGTFRPDRHGDKALVTSEGLLSSLPEVPTVVQVSLSLLPPGEANRFRQWWEHYCEALISAGVLVARDLTCIAMLCDAHLQMEAAELVLQQEGRYRETDKGGVQAHPANVRRETAKREIAACQKELAMTPIARMKGGPVMQDPDAGKTTVVTGRRRG